MPLNIPNILTLLRIALIPVFILTFYLPYSWSNEVTTLIFALAGFTDWLDGYLARRLQQESPFGAFLDPVADKLMVAAALVMLVQAHPTPLLAIPAIIIIGREIAISALREWMAAIGERVKVSVMMIGKLKTSAQMLALLFLLYGDPVGSFSTYEAGVVLIYVAAVLTLWSMIIYLYKAWPVLQGKSS